MLTEQGALTARKGSSGARLYSIRDNNKAMMTEYTYIQMDTAQWVYNDLDYFKHQPVATGVGQRNMIHLWRESIDPKDQWTPTQYPECGQYNRD